MKAVDLPGILPSMLPRLWKFALRLSGDQHEAEDLVQRACIRGLERAGQLMSDSSPLSWMFSIIHSIWVSELRARHVRTRSLVDWDDEFLKNLPSRGSTDPEFQFLTSQIMDAVERLPEIQRVVILLVSVEGLSYQEAADVLDVPIGTVMSRLSRARQAIGAQFVVKDRASHSYPGKRGMLPE